MGRLVYAINRSGTCHFLHAGSNAGSFSCQWLPLGTRKLAPKKIKTVFFQVKFYPLKAHAHCLTILIYLATWRAAKLGIYKVTLM